MNYLNDQIAVVSGASGGIGGAIAAAFARQGATRAYSAATQPGSRRAEKLSVHPPRASIPTLAI